MPRRGAQYLLARGIEARKGRDPESRHGIQGARQAALKRSVGGRRQPGPAQPAAPNFFTSGRMAARRKEITCPAVSPAPALWFGANAGARAFGAERWCGRRGAGGDGVGRRPVELTRYGSSPGARSKPHRHCGAAAGIRARTGPPGPRGANDGRNRRHGRGRPARFRRDGPDRCP